MRRFANSPTSSPTIVVDLTPHEVLVITAMPVVIGYYANSTSTHSPEHKDIVMSAFQTVAKATVNGDLDSLLMKITNALQVAEALKNKR